MKSSQWLCTRFDKDNEHKLVEHTAEYLDKYYTESKARYLAGQVEKCPDTGRLHVQFYLNFKDPVRMSALSKVDHLAHYVKVSKDNGASAYCLKEDTRVAGPWEYG